MRLAVGYQPVALAAQAEQLAANLDGAGFVALQSHQQAQNGGLARAAGADDGDLLACGDVEVEIVQHAELAIGLAHLAEADQRLARRHRARSFHSASPAGGWPMPRDS